MRTLDVIAPFSAFPATALIESAADIGVKRAGVGVADCMADFPMSAQDETRARVAAFFRSGSLNEALAGLRRKRGANV